eukprot:scaffold433_cov257-Pinguiococcus_pyrenoidosus.AAC.30
MCPDLAGYGGPDWLDGGDFGLGTDESRSGNESERLRKKGSPVVPQSSQKLGSRVAGNKIADVQDTVVYTVTLLKGQYEAGYYEGEDWQQGVFTDFVEPFIKVCKESRFTARLFEFDPSKIGEADREIEDLETDVQLARRDLGKQRGGMHGPHFLGEIDS